MSVKFYAEVWCDHCGNHVYGDSKTKTGARKTAKSEGWEQRRISGLLMDLCDGCAASYAERLASQQTTLTCHDCGLAYGGVGWIDALVSDDIWLQISPSHDEGGILCINCISKRCEQLGLDNVPVALQSGVLVNGTVTGVRPIVVSAVK